MKDAIIISPVGEIYELEYMFEDYDGANRSNVLELNLGNATLDEAIANELNGYIIVVATLYRKRVFEDQHGNKYFSELEFIREISA